jgi:hypothetical protein
MTFDQADDYAANQDRTYCLVPDCDEQPYPGDELCQTHQQEQIAYDRRAQKGDRCKAPWAPLQLHTWKDGQCIHCGDSE